MKKIDLVKSSQNHGDLCRRIRMTCIIFFSVNWKREREKVNFMANRQSMPEWPINDSESDPVR